MRKVLVWIRDIKYIGERGFRGNRLWGGRNLKSKIIIFVFGEGDRGEDIIFVK